MNLFKHNKNTISNYENNIASEEKNINDTIELLLLILENLGYLNPSNLEKILSEKLPDYDKSILYRLRISKNQNEFTELEKRIPENTLGYGITKINELKNKYLSLVEKNEEEGKNSFEIEEELIFEVKLELSRYEKILNDFNNTVTDLINNDKLSDIEIIVMIDYWTSYYREEKLGYPPSINQRIVSLIEDLKRLEYGGYGEKEIDKFLEKCQIALRAMKSNTINNEDTIAYIEKNIYKPLKDKYETELVILKKKLALIDDSKELSKEDKRLEKEKFIIDFNEHNGHKIDLSSQLIEMRDSLKSLKYSENEDTIADWFINKIQSLIIKEKKAHKSDKVILALIRVEYEKYLSYYSNRIEKLERKLERTTDKEETLANYKDEITSSFDIGLLIDRKLNKLKESQNFTEEELIEFKRVCQEIERESIFNGTKEQAIENIENYYEELMSKNSQQKEHEINTLKNKISMYANELANLEGNGYNSNTIKEFIEECRKVMETRNSLVEKDLIITKKYNLLRENYYDNLKIFTLWKNNELLKNPNMKEKLEAKVKYVLSLSPKELQLYYEKDDHKKKEAMEKHNNRILVKFLAQEEAKVKNNQSIITERLNSLEKGFIPYTTEELTHARERVEELEYLDEKKKLSKEEKLISISEYIDSTLYKQISNIELSNLNN